MFHEYRGAWFDKMTKALADMVVVTKHFSVHDPIQIDFKEDFEIPTP